MQYGQLAGLTTNFTLIKIEPSDWDVCNKSSISSELISTKKALFKDISFSVRQGEILALTGLVGAGRTEVCQTLFGIMRPDEGKIFLNNKGYTPIRIKTLLPATSKVFLWQANFIILISGG